MPNPSGMVLRGPELKLSIKLITDHFEYVLATSVLGNSYGPPAVTHSKCGKY